MDQGELTGIFCARPQNFAWFLGAGTSRTAGLPTATDILWDLKRRYYCREENQDISRQDIQNDAVRDRIQAFMDSRGFPAPWSEEEYPAYFSKIFGDDRERQRKYIKAILSEERVTLSIGNRVLGALIASRLARIVFTTNFDSVVEKAVAEVSGQSLSAYHLEGAHTANQALNNEEYPIYCKLHGDFRYDSIKNLPSDLANQNASLSECLVNGGNRSGFIVTGYSGRDASIMSLFSAVLESSNPFPHGLFWTGMKGSPVPPPVQELLDRATARNVAAHYVPIETFDAFLLRLWRNIEGKPAVLDVQVRKSHAASVHIPLPPPATGKPILRFNAIPVLSLPKQCVALAFRDPKDWSDINQAQSESNGHLILTKTDTVLCWGQQEKIKKIFSDGLLAISPHDLPIELSLPQNLVIKGFLEQALCQSVIRGKPLLYRTSRHRTFVIANPHAESGGELQALREVVGEVTGVVPGLSVPSTHEHARPEQVNWAEAARVSIDFRDGRPWLLIDPDLWIWPLRARKNATEFMDRRRSNRFNKKYNALLDAWIRLILGTDVRDTQVKLTAFDDGSDFENPAFLVGTRTGYSWRL